VREEINSFVGALRVAEIVVLALALLIAFNSASITVDERTREEATMFAFGYPVRSMMALLTAEAAVTGLLGSLLGLAGGAVVLRWILDVLLARSLPDVAVPAVLDATTIAAVLGLGVAVVALAPLAMVRRLLSMDVASKLRVLE
jgi:putative ABC transport system permease protein